MVINGPFGVRSCTFGKRSGKPQNEADADPKRWTTFWVAHLELHSRVSPAEASDPRVSPDGARSSDCPHRKSRRRPPPGPCGEDLIAASLCVAVLRQRRGTPRGKRGRREWTKAWSEGFALLRLPSFNRQETTAPILE